MEVRISVNKMNSGRMQISARRLGLGVSTGPVVTYKQESDVRKVLSALGFGERLINDQLQVLAEIGPNELLHFPDSNIPEDVLRANGFIAL